jgi:hypothetical protein
MSPFTQESKWLSCRRATYKGKYGKTKEAVESARTVWKRRLVSFGVGNGFLFPGRQEGGSSEGKVPCALHQEFPFFLVHEYLGLEAARLGWTIDSYETWSTRKPCAKEVPETNYLRSKSSTLKGLLYAPIQQKQYLKRTTLLRLKIPLRSICSKADPHSRLSIAWARNLSSDKRQSTFFSWVGNPLAIPYLGCTA